MDLVKQRSFFVPIDNPNFAVTDCAEIDDQWQTDTAREEDLVSRLAHFDKSFDVLSLSLPRQDIRIALNYHKVDQVESLNRVKKMSVTFRLCGLQSAASMSIRWSSTEYRSRTMISGLGASGRSLKA